MQIITIGALKGGTGKTATVFNIAGLLAEKNKILLLDCDPQANLSSNIGVDVNAGNMKNVINIFNDDAPLDSMICKAPNKELSNLDIIPSNIDLTATEFQIVSKAGRENILKTFIKNNHEALSKYDYILIDTNPSMGIINQNAFLAADSIILVSDVSINGLRGVELFMSLWESARKYLNKENNIKALILNNLDKRIKLSAELVEYCNDTENIKDIVLKNIIPSSVQIKKTEINQNTINCLFTDSAVCQAYKNIITELKNRGIL
jgi:chromosome partitioning protein